MKTIVIAVITLLVGSVADARPVRQAISPECNVTMPCDLPANASRRSSRSPGTLLNRSYRPAQVQLAPAGRVRVAYAEDTSSRVVDHPAGCPARLFCACGVAVRVFGEPRRDLWLAAEWVRRFPHVPSSMAQPGMVAARSGHAFYIEQVLGNGTVIAYDANSGRGLTRIHQRSLAGYTVVNPRG